MEEFTDWLTERTVGLTSVIGLSGSTFDISDRILVISLLVSGQFLGQGAILFVF